MSKNIFFVLSALFLLVAFSPTLNAGGGRKGGSNPPPPPSSSVPTREAPIILQFYAANLSGISAFCGIPQNNQYIVSNSSTTNTSNDFNYYCEVKVYTSDKRYNKTHTWIAGSQMYVPLPTTGTYTIDVSYYEPWASSCYSWNGQGRVKYRFWREYSSFVANVYAVVDYVGIANYN